MRKAIEAFSDNRIIGIVLKLIMLLSIIPLCIYIGIVAYQIIAYNIPVEIRDLSTLRAADAFARGINPYSLEEIWASGNTPQIYQYTFLQPLIVSLFMRLTGANSLAISVLLNLIYMLISSILVFRLIKDRYKIATIYYIPIICQLFFAYSMFWGHRAVFTIRADGLGILIMALLYYLMNKKAEYVELIAILTTLLFFTKQFYIIIALPVFVCYLLNDHKKAIRYTLECIILGILELIVCQMIFPTYLTSTIYSQFMSAGHSGGLYDLIKNFALIALRQELPFIIFTIVAGIVLWKALNKNGKNNGDTIKLDKYEIFVLVSIASSLLALFRIAQNGMDGIKYVNALILIPLNIIVFLLSNRLSNLYKIENIMLLVMLAAVFLPLQAYKWKPMDRSEMEAWNKIRQYSSMYDADEEYLETVASMAFYDDADAMSKGYYDDGHLEYFQYDESNALTELFVGVEEQKEAIVTYKGRLEEKIANEELRLIVTQRDNWLIKDADLENNYEVIDTIDLHCVTNGKILEVWQLK